jgi:uncharacterized protein YjbI with pentapeptide repeats
VIKIKSRWDGKALYTAQNAADVRTALEEAVKSRAVLRGAVLSRADLSGADLRGAVLSRADLSGADLSGADLSGAVLSGAVLSRAVLSGADLSGADLSRADLRGAVLSRAVLRGAVLSGADLSRAVLRGADLSRAVLRGAVLRGADLSRAVLRGAVLSGADLSRAVLSRADLRGAVLSGADLSGAIGSPSHPLWAFKQDLWSILDMAPGEVPGLRAALVEGRVDGSTYTGECACLVGTIANVRGVDVDVVGIPKDGSRPAEQWFLAIRKGDVARAALAATAGEGVFRASWALRWVDEWTASRRVIAKALAA